METNRNLPPISTQVLWVEDLPDVIIETQVIYVLTVSHEDIDIRQTLYSMWTYDNTWHLLGGDSIVAISITQEQYTLLVTNNALVAGQSYVITDLTFTYTIGGTSEEATYVESLMVTALTNNTLQPIAYPINHPNDWVEVDWSIPAIIFRHDTLLNNHIGYDYRNKLNRRYKFNVSNIFEPNISYSIGDVVTNETNDIYIAVKDNLSTVLSDGNWFKFPFKNGTYSAVSINTFVYISGMAYSISADKNNYNDYLTFLGNTLNVRTGSNFNNVVSQVVLANCVFGSGNYNLTFNGNCIGITIGNGNHDFYINESQNITIKNANVYFYIDSLFYSNIENHISALGLSNGININIKDSCSNIILTKAINSSVFDTVTTKFVSTVNIVDLHIKPNISLVNLTSEVLNLFPLGFHKTIENMFIEGGVRPMLYYMDADSSLPILVEIQ